MPQKLRLQLLESSSCLYTQCFFSKLQHVFVQVAAVNMWLASLWEQSNVFKAW